MDNSEFLGLRTTVYMVTDLAEGKNWFTKAFGTEPYFDEAFYVGYNIAGYELGLLPSEKDNSNKADGAISYWGVQDIDKMYKKLLDLGALEHETPNNVGGELMVASVKDPWNNIIGIIYNPYFKLPE